MEGEAGPPKLRSLRDSVVRDLQDYYLLIVISFVLFHFGEIPKELLCIILLFRP